VEVGGKKIENIIVTNLENEVIAIVTDQEIVELEGYKVILEPTKQ